MVKETIYVDESGNAGVRNVNHNNQHPYFIIGFAFCHNPLTLKIELRRLIRKLHRRGKYALRLKELKFYPYNSLEKLGYSKSEIQRDWEPHFNYVRQKTVTLIAKYCDGVFAGILDKRTIGQPTWTSETIGNFLFNRSLFQHILPNLNFKNTPEILYDRGRLTPSRTLSFNQYMLNTDSYLTYFGTKRYNGNVVTFKDVDSLSNSGIWASDFVAGSFRHALLQIDASCLMILQPKFIGNGSLNLWF